MRKACRPGPNCPSAWSRFARLPHCREAPALAAANKRIGNILKKVPPVDPHVSEVLLTEPAEIALVCGDARTRSGGGGAVRRGRLHRVACRRWRNCVRPVDAFFESVMVNAPEMDLRLNRQGLLQALHDAMNRVADLSRLDSGAA